MASVDRQNRLIVAEDWKKIYQSFKNADFQSYDFDNLRRTMIGYLRENYPEDFNDYIESSEYLALIDLIAFLGQNLAFRFDLNARDNFLELAERRESVLRLARLVSYNAKRNQAANGVLKFTSVQTSESVLDSNGRNLANQTIVWNDSSNSNWYDQFIRVINASLPETSRFGKPQDSAIISGIKTEQYRVVGTNTEVPIYTFNKNIDGRNVPFEVVSAAFKNEKKIYEEPPFPGNSLAFLYKDDGHGSASSNTGFFVYFKQGTLQESSFSIQRPSTNEVIDIESPNINDEDVWLYSLDAIGLESTLWTKVSSTVGNNVIYNSVSKNIRTIYSVLTRSNDRIRLSFADGVFGELPQGNFKTYYRTSNGLSYTINPTDIRNVTIEVPYLSAAGSEETLTISASLKYTISNATTTESTDEIKTNAPAVYYSQGRMITGEDYNVLPLSVNQEIIKIKSINRVSSGISRYFDFKDTSGKYSSTNLFGTDGVLYKESIENIVTFSATSLTDIGNNVTNIIEPLLSIRAVKDFYLDSFPRIKIPNNDSVSFVKVTSATNLTTGFFIDSDKNIKKIGSFTTSNLKYLTVGSMAKFMAPVGKVFSANGVLISDVNPPAGFKTSFWTKVVRVTGNGTGTEGVLDNGTGPVAFNDIVPTGAVLTQIIPKYVTSFESSVKSKLIDLIYANKTFGLRYDSDASTWVLVYDANLNKKSAFSLNKTGDISNQNLDASWIIMAETNGETYTVTTRGIRYVFESDAEIRFFYDSNSKVYDPTTGKIIRDTINVLGINSAPGTSAPLNADYTWDIIGEYKGADGYVDTKKIVVSFFDSDDDGVIDNPDMFTQIVGTPSTTLAPYIFQYRRSLLDNVFDFYYTENSNNLIKIYDTVVLAGKDTTLTEGQLVYILSDNTVKTTSATQTFSVNSEYRGYLGRDKLKFQYVHAADSSSRIDPAATNFIDVYMLTRTYDTAYRRWISGAITTKPEVPTSDELYINFGQQLNKIKAISDEIIYHPVKYKNLFGATADSSLQATFKIVKAANTTISDNDIKTNTIAAINEFFSIENWEFGDTFYFSELDAYIMNKLAPTIANIVIVPTQANLKFGSLIEIKSNSDEIFISSATVDNIEIISEITAPRIKASSN